MPRSAPLRGQSTRKSWSYRLLTKHERQLFERLSIFAGGWDLDAAEQVCASDDMPREQIVDLLGSLVEKSLVVVGEAPDGDSRFNYLETVREYARLALAGRGSAELETTRHLHASHYVHRTEQLNPDVLLFDSADLRRVELEQENIRSALSWCIDNGRPSLGVRIANAMQLYWLTRGMYGEAQHWLDSLLRLADSGSYEALERADDEVILPLQRVFALRGAAVVVGNNGDATRARALIGEAAALMEKIDRGSRFHAQTVALRGLSEWTDGDSRSGIASAKEGLRYSQSIGAPVVTSLALRVLGNIALSQSRYEDAVGLFTESGSVYPARGGRRNVEAEVAGLLARTYSLCGAYEKADTYFREALEIVRAEHIHSYVLGHCLEWYASLQITFGRAVEGAVLYGAAEAVWRAGGGIRWAPWQASYEREVAELDAQLDSQQRDAAWREGTRLSPEEAADFALALNATLNT